MKNWIKCTGAFYRDSVALCRSRIAAADREIGGKALSAATRSVQESRSCFFLQWKCGTGYPHDAIHLCSQNTEEDPLMAAATKYAAAQIESEVDGKCCPMQKQSSALMKKKAI